MNTKLKPCPPGKVRNPKTNRCKKIEKTSPSKKKTLKPCPPGKVRNPKTNRCKNVEKKQTKGKPQTKRKTKSKSKSKSKTLKPCPPGKVRNPMTNRCKKTSAPAPQPKAAPVSKYFEKQWEKFNTQMKGAPDIKDALVNTPEEASPVQETPPQDTVVPPLEEIVKYDTSQEDFMKDYRGKSYAFCLNSNDEFVSDEDCEWFKDFQDALEHLRTQPGQYSGLHTDPSYFTIYICNLENGKELRENSTEIARTTEVTRGDLGMQGPGVEGAEDSGYPEDISKFKITVNTYAKELPPNELQNKEIYVWEENEGDHQYASVTQPDNDDFVKEVTLR